MPSGHAHAADHASFLSLRDLTKEYTDFTAVSRLNLDVAKGELMAFLGPSGCGKTTSLRLIAGLIPATSGRIVVGGRDLTHVPPYRRDMGLVFQSYALFPHMSVAANVAFGLQMRKIGRAESAERVRDAIALVRLQGKEDRRPSQLSGGQQQRVALARALVVRPQILLLDEPLSNLDAKLRDEMRTEIREIQQRIGITAIFVTHDQSEALTMCDRVAVLNAGGVEQVGTPQDLYERPATPFVAGFVGRTNRLAVVADQGRVALGGTSIRLRGGQSGPLVLLMRPHRIQIAASAAAAEITPGADDYAVTGRVLRATYAGDLLHYEINVGPHVVLVERPTSGGEALLGAGTAVSLRWRVDDTLVFAGEA